MYIYLNSVHKYLYVHSKTDHNQLLHSLGVCLSARFKVGAKSAPGYGRCCKAGESQVTLPGVGFLSLLPKFME